MSFTVSADFECIMQYFKKLISTGRRFFSGKSLPASLRDSYIRYEIDS